MHGNTSVSKKITFNSFSGIFKLRQSLFSCSSVHFIYALLCDMLVIVSLIFPER